MCVCDSDKSGQVPCQVNQGKILRTPTIRYKHASITYTYMYDRLLTDKVVSVFTKNCTYMYTLPLHVHVTYSVLYSIDISPMPS